MSPAQGRRGVSSARRLEGPPRSQTAPTAISASTAAENSQLAVLMPIDTRLVAPTSVRQARNSHWQVR